MAENKNDTTVTVGENGRMEEIARGCFVYSADGCSNTGFVVGERGVLVIDGQANTELAEGVLQNLRGITDKPVKHLVLTHFHADTTAGASAFDAGDIVASDLTQRMFESRGTQEIGVARKRLPDLYKGEMFASRLPKATMTIASSMSIDLGGVDVRIMHLGRGHTMGDVVVWIPGRSVIFAGDLVQTNTSPYCGDAHLTDWPRALDRITAFRPTALVPGRGRAVSGTNEIASALENTRSYILTLRDAAAACVEQGLGLADTYAAVKDALSPEFGGKLDFEDNLSINVARAYDEALGLDQPQVWTSERLNDLKDALSTSGSVVAEQNDLDPDQSLAEGENIVGLESFREEAREVNGGQPLVSDSAFAASLNLLSEDELTLMEESPEVADDSDDQGLREPAAEEKVLEQARA